MARGEGGGEERGREIGWRGERGIKLGSTGEKAEREERGSEGGREAKKESRRQKALAFDFLSYSWKRKKDGGSK